GVLIAFFIAVNPNNLLALLDLAGVDTQKRKKTEEVRRVQVGNVCLQQRIHVGGRYWQDVVDHIEKRLQRVTLRDVCIARVFSRRNACAARGVESRQVKQFFISRSRLSVFEAYSNLQQQDLRVRDNFFN